MGSFEDHMRYGVAAYVVFVVGCAAVVGYLVYSGRAGVTEAALGAAGAVGGFPFAVAGAGFPDIDHHAAKPHRFFKRWVSVIAGIVGAYLLYASGVAVEAGAAAMEEVTTASIAPEPLVGVAVAGIGGVGAGVAAYVGVGVLKPPHRGVTHSLPAGLVVSVLVGVGVGYAASVVGAVLLPSPPLVVGGLTGGVVSSAFFVGFLSHLQCDGLLVGFLPDAM
jgi:hypothetical protein